jgi:hypothetical protein
MELGYLSTMVEKVIGDLDLAVLNFGLNNRRLTVARHHGHLFIGRH